MRSPRRRPADKSNPSAYEGTLESTNRLFSPRLTHLICSQQMEVLLLNVFGPLSLHFPSRVLQHFLPGWHYLFTAPELQAKSNLHVVHVGIGADLESNNGQRRVVDVYQVFVQRMDVKRVFQAKPTVDGQERKRELISCKGLAIPNLNKIRARRTRAEEY